MDPIVVAARALADLLERAARTDTCELLSFDWTPWTPEQKRNIIALAEYELGYRVRRREPHSARFKTARALFLSYLSPAARAEWRRCGYVTVIGSAGGCYRIWPRMPTTWRLERCGSRWRCAVRFCYHDPESELPPGDVALAHLLMLTTDEPGFLAAANHTTRDWWDRRRAREWRAA